ncbi:MAG TPA: DNA-directed RNA polymerase subunit beta' [Anaerolineaceae bacterium]|nr:DNA-directed RNA polymerase subunit beta' [Anaerolineaceae bacterium]
MFEFNNFDSIQIGLASPEKIREWSRGEVKKPETINYRTLKPEKDGLFDERIFGPTKDWECYCGKYKRIRYKGIICDKCGVEVTRASVRRERMGHIDLATPVAHIWYTRRIPSYLGLLLDISRRNLDRVLYFAQYIVTFVDDDARQKALKRLEDEINDTERAQASSINSKILDVKSGRDKKIAEFMQKKADIESKADEQTASRLEPVIQEGQTLEKMLTEKMGQVLKKKVDFTAADVTIADVGDTVNSKHISSVQKAVKESLEEIESEFKKELQRDLEQIKMSIETIKAEADEVMETLRNSLEDSSSVSQDQNSHLRDELQELHPFTFLTESRYRELKSRWGQVFRADMGAEAFYDVLRRLDLEKLSADLWTEVRTSKSKQKRKKATTRLKVVESFRRSGNRPEWMILTVLPVIPPDLRPMVPLDGGRFATSDMNDLYRRVINRNNRLKRLLELGAPDVIVRNEKRMLQEAVDSLIDNSQRGKALSRRGRRELKSLSDMLKGKKGRFRRNLLGKRVDYSGRSVIVVGPQLKLYQCGLPKSMALELFRPFVISRLVAHSYAANVKGARRFIERNRPEVYEVLEEVIKERPVLLNRAPTLHRLGIQAFEPILIEGSAIQLHPLVTTAFNADFDGDQMAVHVPLSEKAVREARTLMLSSKNLLKPADGEPIISPGKDMVLGVYYLTMEDNRTHKGDGRAFADIDEVDLAYQLEQVELHTDVNVKLFSWFTDDHVRLEKPETRMIKTTVGRVLFNRILPPEVQFDNRVLEKTGIKNLIADVYDICGETVTTEVADNIKDIGFQYAMKSGITIAVADISVPEEKVAILAASQSEVDQINKGYRRGLLTEQERNEQVIKVWQDTTKEVGDAVRKHMDPNGNLATMASSGATKGGFGPIAQLAGMRGLMADPSGRIIRLPITSNFREGLTALEYFISTHGARKGLADTALRTADAGYLTRRLVDIAQDIIINEVDCGTEDGIWIRKEDDVAGQNLGERLFGRSIAARIVDPKTGEVIGERDQLLDHEMVRKVMAAGVDKVFVRSAMTCSLIHGICAKCYGMDLGRGELVVLGSAVGVVAAQSIGEPGTQLTLRTFHTGGVASGGDITTGLPRVEELFEARRMPKGEAVVSSIAGVASMLQTERVTDQRIVRVEHSEMVSDEYEVPADWKIQTKDETNVAMGDVIADFGEAQITAQHNGRVRVEKRKVIVSYEQRESEEYEIPSTSRLIIRDGQKVEAGEPLTEGSINPHTILKIKGREAAQIYLMTEVQKVYRAQGQNINDKHFEVIIRKMVGKVQVIRPGDSHYLPMDVIDRLEIKATNEKLIAEGKQPARFVEILLGVTKASLSTDSFLSAASFQHTIKVLAGAAIASTEDPLFGLKENVIIGKLIPAGTGFVHGRFTLPADKAVVVEEVIDLDGAAPVEPLAE